VSDHFRGTDLGVAGAGGELPRRRYRTEILSNHTILLLAIEGLLSGTPSSDSNWTITFVVIGTGNSE